MNCSAFRSHLEELSPDSVLRGEVQSHVAACPACADFYHQHSTLNNLIQSIDCVAAPPDFNHKLNARLNLARHALPSPRFLYLNFIPGTASIAFASFFVLAVCAAVLLKETQSGDNAAPSRRAQQTQTVAVLADFPESAQPAPLNDVPVNRRDGYTNIASASPKITAISSPKRSIDGKSKSNFVDLRREAGAPEKDSKAIEIIAPQTKSAVFSSGAAPIITRPAATSLTDTQNPSGNLIESPQAKESVANPFLASGVETKTLTARLANGYGTSGGLFVVSVQPQSAAFRAGLRSGDVIEAVNNQAPSGARLPQNLKDANGLSLTVARGNQRLSIIIPTPQSTHQ
ncbi:MAG: PDZ domain-containing protein [Pyrinomonadaceae bacterium]